MRPKACHILAIVDQTTCVTHLPTQENNVFSKAVLPVPVTCFTATFVGNFWIVSNCLIFPQQFYYVLINCSLLLFYHNIPRISQSSTIIKLYLSLGPSYFVHYTKLAGKSVHFAFCSQIVKALGFNVSRTATAYLTSFTIEETRYA